VDAGEEMAEEEENEVGLESEEVDDEEGATVEVSTHEVGVSVEAKPDKPVVANWRAAASLKGELEVLVLEVRGCFIARAFSSWPVTF